MRLSASVYWACIFAVQKSRIGTGPVKKIPVRLGILDIFTIYSTEPPFSRISMIFTTRPRSYWINYPVSGYFQVQAQFARMRVLYLYISIIFSRNRPTSVLVLCRGLYWKFENTSQAISYFFLAFSKWTLQYLEKYRMSTRTGFSFSPGFYLYFFPVWMRPSYWKFKLEISRQLFQYTNAYSLRLMATVRLQDQFQCYYQSYDVV